MAAEKLPKWEITHHNYKCLCKQSCGFYRINERKYHKEIWYDTAELYTIIIINFYCSQIDFATTNFYFTSAHMSRNFNVSPHTQSNFQNFFKSSKDFKILGIYEKNMRSRQNDRRRRLKIKSIIIRRIILRHAIPFIFVHSFWASFYAIHYAINIHLCVIISYFCLSIERLDERIMAMVRVSFIAKKHTFSMSVEWIPLRRHAIELTLG